MDRTTNKLIGAICQLYRTDVLGKYQCDVSEDTGYAIETISSFENGRNNNATILLWYVLHGLDADFIKYYIGGDLIEYFKNEHK
jgi:transcriptional regulator with XRE-family HTH domain